MLYLAWEGKVKDTMGCSTHLDGVGKELPFQPANIFPSHSTPSYQYSTSDFSSPPKKVPLYSVPFLQYTTTPPTFSLFGTIL